MYTFQSRVRYSEVNSERVMDLYSILNYFQDCSNFHSEDVGVGIDFLTARQRVWLLSSWQIEIIRAPRLFDRITVGTWPYDFNGIYGYRNFILYNEDRDHEVAACANSIWFLLDTETGSPARITPEDTSAYALEEKYPMEYAPRRLSLPPADALLPENYPEVPVTRMLLDTNNHVNNGQYVRIAESCLPKGFSVLGMRAEYRKAAVLGDRLCPVLLTPKEPQDDSARYVSLNDPDGKTFAIVSFHQ